MGRVNEITIGSLYSGYGGLELAVAAASALSVRTLWHCDPDPDCQHVLKVHRPDVPNLGSDDTVDWTRVERPDLVDLGPPCQPVSAAGLNLGANDPRWRWPYARTALVTLRPAAFVFENVSGLTQGRKLALWLGILADMRALGYAVAWTVVGACYVGAPMHRHRVFAVGRLRADPPPAVRHGDRELCDDVRPLLPSPMARDGDPKQRGEGSPEYWAGRLQRRAGQGIPLGAVVKLLSRDDWAQFAPAVAHWENLTRPAPAPSEPTGRGGGYRLAPELPEWMHGLPAGYLTDHLDRPAALRLAGNGVCPPQAAWAIRTLWPLVPR